MRFSTALVMTCAASLAVSEAEARTWTVCPSSPPQESCAFTGDRAIQQAVDAARDGDHILVKPGIYKSEGTRDVAFEDLVIRGYITIAGKALRIVGEPGAVLDGSDGARAVAVLLHKADVVLSGIEIRGFRVDEPEDDIYDGHGVFLIDSKLQARDLVIRKVEKMAISVRGDSDLVAERLQILDNHMGLWVRENARVSFTNSVVRNTRSAGISAYGSSVTRIVNAEFSGALDDGIYAGEQARIHVSNSLVTGNSPMGVNGDDDSHIAVDHSMFWNNAADYPAKATVVIGPGVERRKPEDKPAGIGVID